MSLHLETVGQGPDLVLLHGWGMHGGVWGPVVEALADSFRLHLLDLPGLGHSGSITPYTLDSLVGAVAEIAPACAAVCGWSLGGQVALRWALTRPQQIEKLVLVGTTPCFVSGADWDAGIDAEVFRQFAAQVQQDYRATLSRFLALQAELHQMQQSVHEESRRVAQLEAQLGTLHKIQQTIGSDARLAEWLAGNHFSRQPRFWPRRAGGVTRTASRGRGPIPSRRRCPCAKAARRAVPRENPGSLRTRVPTCPRP